MVENYWNMHHNCSCLTYSYNPGLNKSFVIYFFLFDVTLTLYEFEAETFLWIFKIIISATEMPENSESHIFTIQPPFLLKYYITTEIKLD